MKISQKIYKQFIYILFRSYRNLCWKMEFDEFFKLIKIRNACELYKRFASKLDDEIERLRNQRDMASNLYWLTQLRKNLISQYDFAVKANPPTLEQGYSVEQHMRKDSNGCSQALQAIIESVDSFKIPFD